MRRETRRAHQCLRGEKLEIGRPTTTRMVRTTTKRCALAELPSHTKQLRSAGVFAFRRATKKFTIRRLKIAFGPYSDRNRASRNWTVVDMFNG